jgi:hypothetical protein
MYSRSALLVTGLVAGLAVGLFALLALTAGSERQADPRFDVDLFDTPTPTPGDTEPRATETQQDSRQALERLIERLQALREIVPPAAERLPAKPPEPQEATPAEDAASDPSCRTEHESGDGVSRTTVRCEQRVVVEDGSSSSVSISSSTSSSVTSTSPDSP